MQKSIAIINLALAKYHQMIDADMQGYNKDLNKVMKVFTYIMISFMPQAVIGCLWGMNCSVPWQYNEDNEDSLSMVYFYGITSFTFLFTIVAFCYFRNVNYI